MAQTSQFGTPAKLGLGVVVVALIALAAFFMQPKATPPIAKAPNVAPAETPVETPMETLAAEPILPSLDVVRVTPDGQATIAGRAAPEAVVSLQVDGAEIASAPADAAGAYASLFTLPASDKVRILTVAATGKDGVQVLGKDQVVLAPTVLPQVAALAADPAKSPDTTVSDTTTPDTTTPDTTTPDTTAANTTAANTTAPDATAPPAALKITESGVQVLEAPQIANNIVINSITYENEVVKVGGLGQADQAVRLYVDGAEAGSTQIAANGTWTALLGQIAPGVYTLRADQLDQDGKVTSRYETPFKRESIEALVAATAPTEPEPAAPATVTVQPGLTLWAIAKENFGAGTMYVQVFEANKDQIRDPNLIYPGQVFTIPKEQ